MRMREIHPSVHLHRLPLGTEDLVIPAPRVPFVDRPPSEANALSKACSAKSALIGKQPRRLVRWIPYHKEVSDEKLHWY